MSRQLALEGGRPLVRRPIPPLISIGQEEIQAVGQFLNQVSQGHASLSGYLAGSKRGGAAVQRLEERWCEEFGVKFAVACNSGTSALLAAYAAASPYEGYDLILPAMGMSAVAAVAEILGYTIHFADIDSTFLMTASGPQSAEVVVTVNLFGQPISIAQRDCIWIEDNAQAPWATFDGQYSGTLGDLGCWSLNVHKPFNTGEGGVVTTNDMRFAEAVRHFVNHGEVAGDQPGLNLRMPELTAVLALAQMPRAKRIVERRRQIAHGLGGKEREGCVSSWYCFPILAPSRKARDWVVKALIAEGVPARAGYVLIHKLPAFAYLNASCPNAEDLESRLILLELCSMDPDDDQVVQMREAIDQVMRICR